MRFEHSLKVTLIGYGLDLASKVYQHSVSGHTVTQIHLAYRV
jgi:hypothetical protein